MLGVLMSFVIGTASAASGCPAAEYGNIPTKTLTVSICHTNFLTEYSTKYHIPIVVNWNVTRDELKNCNKRKGSFHQDVLAGGIDIPSKEYTNSGYDRGHLSPAEDNLFSNSTEFDSFSMTNITPQVAELNRNGWKWFENLTRLYAFQYGKVVVYSGVVLKSKHYIKNEIAIPDSFWKIVYIPSINKNISILVPNEEVKGDHILDYLSTPSEIEKTAGVYIPLPSNADKDDMGYDDDVKVKNSNITMAKVCNLF